MCKYCSKLALIGSLSIKPLTCNKLKVSAIRKISDPCPNGSEARSNMVEKIIYFALASNRTDRGARLSQKTIPYLLHLWS